MSSKDTKRLGADGEITEGPRTFGERELKDLADYVYQEKVDRKTRRKDREELWREVDRQIDMKPDPALKMDSSGRVIAGREWLPEIEMPFQAQTLEVLTADTRRLLFPSTKDWFLPRSNVSDDLIQNLQSRPLVAGDNFGVLSEVVQDDVDELVQSFLIDQHRLYDFRGEVDRFNVGAFKRGTGVGRIKTVKKRVVLETAHGVEALTKEFPMLLAEDVWNVLLDDTHHKLQREGVAVGPSTIRVWKQNKLDLAIQSEQGTTDVDDPIRGGWFKEEVKKLLKEAEDEKGHVHFKEMEGDIVVSRREGGEGFFLPSALVTVAQCGAACRTVRIRFTKQPFSSYIVQPYHLEHFDTPYGSGPLIKGSPLQKMLSLIANLLAAAGVWDVLPTIFYSSDNAHFQATGGPALFPGAMVETVNPERGVVEVSPGDVASLSALFSALVNLYADLTGMQAPRLGADVKSHTTAFANDQALQRGAVRTVDYANSFKDHGLTQFLQKEYWLSRRFRGAKTFLMRKRGVYVEVRSDQLPEEVDFDVFGADAPVVEQANEQRKQAALISAMQVEQVKIQAAQATGQAPRTRLDFDRLQETLLKDAGFESPQEFLVAATDLVSGGAAGGQQLPGIAAVNPSSLATGVG